MAGAETDVCTPNGPTLSKAPARRQGSGRRASDAASGPATGLSADRLTGAAEGMLSKSSGRCNSLAGPVVVRNKRAAAARTGTETKQIQKKHSAHHIALPFALAAMF